MTYVQEPVFTDVSWEIHSNKVAGLVGPNGAGKSTLLRIIAGEVKSDSGFVNAGKKDLTVGYLSQEPKLTSGRTVLEETLSASQELYTVEEKLAQVESDLAKSEVYDDEKALTRTLTRQEKLLDDYERLGGANYESRVNSTLRSLGFDEAELSLSVDVLSGGQKKLVGLAKLLITKPDLLLLDEPDNHLDLDGKEFLEKYIRGYKGAVVIVSHDRYLLDLVVDEIVEMEDGRITRYPGNYSEYAFEKQAAAIRQQQLYQTQQKEIKRLEQSAQRMLLWGRQHDNAKFITRGKSMLKRIDKIERIEKPVIERARMGMEMAGWRGSNKVLEVNDLTKTFPAGENGGGESTIFSDVDILVWRGERTGLVGPNGAGKTVLFRILLGQEEPTSGEIVIGPSVKVGFYSQEHETLDYDSTLIDIIRHATNVSENNAVKFLSRFLFTYEQARGLVSSLSGGERSRLQMALLTLSGANFLLLDEPTNNLDIASAEVLEEALEEFEGTVLVISHDRYFLDRVAGRIIELDQGGVTDYTGGYSDYQAKKAGE